MQKGCRNNPCQHFGSKSNLNVHLHVLALDGAYSFEHGKARIVESQSRNLCSTKGSFPGWAKLVGAPLAIAPRFTPEDQIGIG